MYKNSQRFTDISIPAVQECHNQLSPEQLDIPRLASIASDQHPHPSFHPLELQEEQIEVVRRDYIDVIQSKYLKTAEQRLNLFQSSLTSNSLPKRPILQTKVKGNPPLLSQSPLSASNTHLGILLRDKCIIIPTQRILTGDNVFSDAFQLFTDDSEYTPVFQCRNDSIDVLQFDLATRELVNPFKDASNTKGKIPKLFTFSAWNHWGGPCNSFMLLIGSSDGSIGIYLSSKALSCANPNSKRNFHSVTRVLDLSAQLKSFFQSERFPGVPSPSHQNISQCIQQRFMLQQSTCAVFLGAADVILLLIGNKNGSVTIWQTDPFVSKKSSFTYKNHVQCTLKGFVTTIERIGSFKVVVGTSDGFLCLIAVDSNGKAEIEVKSDTFLFSPIKGIVYSRFGRELVIVGIGESSVLTMGSSGRTHTMSFARDIKGSILFFEDSPSLLLVDESAQCLYFTAENGIDWVPKDMTDSFMCSQVHSYIQKLIESEKSPLFVHQMKQNESNRIDLIYSSALSPKESKLCLHFIPWSQKDPTQCRLEEFRLMFPLTNHQADITREAQELYEKSHRTLASVCTIESIKTCYSQLLSCNRICYHVSSPDTFFTEEQKNACRKLIKSNQQPMKDLFKVFLQLKLQNTCIPIEEIEVLSKIAHSDGLFDPECPVCEEIIDLSTFQCENAHLFGKSNTSPLIDRHMSKNESCPLFGST